MARREDIVNTIWDELDHLSDDALMLYVWSWTNLKCGMAGIYPITRRKLVEGRFDAGRLDAALAECETEGLLRYEKNVLWNVARVKRISGISEQMGKSIAKDLAEIAPSNSLLAAFLDKYGSHPQIKPHLTLTRGSGDPHPKVDTEPDRRGSGEGHETLPGRSRDRDIEIVEVPENYQPILEALDRVAFSRALPSPNVASSIKACRDFAHRDLPVEVDKFAHWWIDGPGEKRKLKDIVGAWRNWLRRGDEVQTAPDFDPSPYEQQVREVSV